MRGKLGWISAMKTRYIVLALIMLTLALPFIWWMLTPKKALDIVVMNKTFPVVTNGDGSISKLDYSKQRGLFWLLKQNKIVKPAMENYYELQKDYYGNFLSGEKLESRLIPKLEEVPDLIFLLDAYGTGKSREKGIEPDGISGLTKEEVSFIATNYAKGSTVIGEYNIAGDPTSEPVSRELEEIFGVRFTGIAGKFFSELSSAEDVPEWIRTTYEQQYGKRWAMEGAGIVIAGNNRIVVLERNIGFEGSTLRLTIEEGIQKDYKTETVDYYNWFEIVEPRDPDSVIAWYNIDLTDEGEKQLKDLGLNDGAFPAIIDNRDGGKRAVYMAGDFSDYRGPERFLGFAGAVNMYRFFSMDHEGDLSYFYWRFYIPFMTAILKETEAKGVSSTDLALLDTSASGLRLMSRIMDKQWSVFKDNMWVEMHVKGVNIGLTVPGFEKGVYPDSASLYTEWFEKIGEMNANTIRVASVMPPEFYRALEVYNYSYPERRLYLLQDITLDKTSLAGNYLDSEYHTAFEKEIEKVVDVIHGNYRAELTAEAASSIYSNDVSGYLLGYIIQPQLTLRHVAANDAVNRSYRFDGEYVAAGAEATPTEAWLASLADRVFKVEQDTYQMQHLVAIASAPELEAAYQAKLPRADHAKAVSASVNVEHLTISTKVETGLLSAYRLIPNELRQAETLEITDYETYLKELIAVQAKYPVLISEYGLATGLGVTESRQAEEIVSMIRSIQASGAVGGLLYEWTDSWGVNRTLADLYMNPPERGVLWHNVDEPMQNYGVVALESRPVLGYSVNLKGHEPLNSMSLAADETYFHIKADFIRLPDFKTGTLMLYLDTIDRKHGEYMLAPDVNENWSGVEFNVRIEDRENARLLVVPAYNRSKGLYQSEVSTQGIFEEMRNAQEDYSILRAGDFDNSDSHFYFEGNTLHVRIPWTRLNFTDPSSMLVLHGEQTVKQTDGVVVSLAVMDKELSKVDYQFPESVTSSGYRTFAWGTWDKPQYSSRYKESYQRIQEAFAAIGEN